MVGAPVFKEQTFLKVPTKNKNKKRYELPVNFICAFKWVPVNALLA